MNAQELRDAGVVNVKLVYNSSTGLPPGTTQSARLDQLFPCCANPYLDWR